MKISTRGRYALRLMIDIAQQNTEEPIPLKEIAKRQEISVNLWFHQHNHESQCIQHNDVIH